MGAARRAALAVALQLARPTLADLPIHCTLADAVGEWTFHLGPAQPMKGQLPGCGHSLPNSVASMLSIDHNQEVPPASGEQVSITLTEEILEQPVRHLKAVDGAGNQGIWTMVYDTGFEIRVGERSIAAHFFFDDLANSVPMDGDNWEKIGKYFGRKSGHNYLGAGGTTYACHCDVTSTGWWSKPAQDGGLEAGCLWATKKGLVEPGVSLADWLPDRSPISSLVRLRQAPQPAGHSGLNATRGAAASVGAGAFVLGGSSLGAELGLDVDASGHAIVKEVIRLADVARPTAAAPPPSGNAAAMGGAPRSAASLRGVSAHVAHHSNKTVELPDIVSHNMQQRKLNQLPANFDWREELAGMVPPGQDPLAEQSDQGPCGSCYAFAGIMVLQMRFRVQLYKQHGILYPLELSYKSPTRCSPYTEGCNGGFSYFIFRLASEVGVPLVGCDQSTPAGALQMACDWSCYKDNKQLFYAKDYWHVGGFSHGSNEDRIMREIYENGPVELAFSTSAVPEFVKLSGQSAKDETDVMTVVLNDRAPKERYSSNPSVNRWWFATHAILAVGWGEEKVSWGMVKYWVVRNSWGRSWGDGGYAKMRRGNNDGGAETDASMVVPDLGRLPEGFLEKARKYHADQEGNRKAWKAQASGGRLAPAGHNHGGVPDYCKSRPNSIDCQ